MAWESFPEVLHLAQPLKNPFVYIFSLSWYRHLYMKYTVVHWGQCNWHEGCGRKIGNFYSIGTKSIEVFSRPKKEASRTCNAVGAVYSALLM